MILAIDFSSIILTLSSTFIVPYRTPITTYTPNAVAYARKKHQYTTMLSTFSVKSFLLLIMLYILHIAAMKNTSIPK